MAIVPQMYYHGNFKFYQPENKHLLAPYVLKNIAQGMPFWMVDYERSSFRTHMDSGANPDALHTWNYVRKCHGFPELTRDDLKERMRVDKGWTKEKSDWEDMMMTYYFKHGEFPDEEFTGVEFERDL